MLSGGNNDVVLCERGIRTFETATRNTLDIAAIPIVKKLSHLPVIVDPSHAIGRRDKVAPVARAAVAVGDDGLLIEVHCDPDHALSDGAQSMFPAQFDRLMSELRIIAPAIGRSICLETGAARMGEHRAWSSCYSTWPTRGGQARSSRKSALSAWPDRRLHRARIPRSGRRRWSSASMTRTSSDGMRLHAIDVAADDLIVLAEVDVGILAAPVRQNMLILAALDEHVRVPAVVTDTGSTKRAMIDAARALPPRFTFVGGHPLGGAARGGLEHARTDLFKGRPWLLTPTGDDTGDAVEKLSARARPGSGPRWCRWRHDRLLAYWATCRG